MSNDDDLLDDDLNFDEDDGQTVDFEDDGATMDIPDDLEPDPAPKKKSSGGKSPLATRGKSTGGNKFFAIVIFLFTAGAIGFGYMEFANPLVQAELLANGNSAERQEAFTYFQEQKRNDWLKIRMEGWLKHRRIDSRRYGAQMLTNRALLGESDMKIAAVTRLTEMLQVEEADDLLRIELIENLAQLGLDGSGYGAPQVLANCVLSNESGRLVKDRDIRNYALENLNAIKTGEVSSLLIGIVQAFEAKSLKDLTRDDRDLRVKAYRYISDRLVESVKGTDPGAKAAGADWDLQLDMTRALLAGYFGDTQPPKTDDGQDLNDHRVRRFSWTGLVELKNRRGAQIWGDFLGEKSDKLARTVAVARLREISDRTFGFDPEDPESDTSEWQSWIDSYTP